MKRIARRYRGLVLLATLAACTHLAACTQAPPEKPSPFAGAWVSQGPTMRGGALLLEPHGGTLEGRFLVRFAAYPLRDGEVADDTLSFELEVEADQPPDSNGKLAMTTIEFAGKLVNDQLELDVEATDAGKGGKMVARRASEEETASIRRMAPPRLPLPELLDLPDNGLARTPPMGWNSWNRFALEIDDATVRGIGQALVDTGMRDAGYVYVVIDDGWQGKRGDDGVLRPNEKFSDMKALADHLHGLGLRLGIYSSPGPLSCGGFAGSYGHEEQDARTFASWGIDYLKYDWCSAGGIYGFGEMRAVYQKMAQALRATNRGIVFSICQYGLADVWQWAPRAGGNLWRTTADIADSWNAMAMIGFAQGELAPWAGPGHWNDPDMLEVGNGGMTTEEYRTHMSLWALLAAPLIAGNDVRASSPETLAILTNREVIAIDQDPLGHQGTPIRHDGEREVWVKQLSDGRHAIGLFNLTKEPTTMEVRWDDAKIAAPQHVRDVWAGADRGVFTESFSTQVPSHGVALLVVRPDTSAPAPATTPTASDR